jgi:positive regulator of sigma E activity
MSSKENIQKPLESDRLSDMNINEDATMKASTFIHYILCPILLFLSVLSLLWLCGGFMEAWNDRELSHHQTVWQKFLLHALSAPHVSNLFSFPVIILGNWYLRIVALMLFIECPCFVYMISRLLSN